MSSSADINTSAGKPLPVYKRKRRRIYGAIAVAVIVAVALIIWAVTQGGGSSGPATLPSFTISVSQGTVASPDSVILSQPSLEKTIPAHLHTVPFDAGVTAIAEMKSGSVQAISGVGNPPATAAIGINTGVTVVMGWGFDDDQLLVPKSVTSPGQLAGKSVGVLVGSSEDYELLGYLALEHLTGKVKVVSFASETQAGTAALSGAIDAAYVYGAPATDLIAKGDHSLVNAEQIAKLGIPGLDVIAVATSVIKSDPTLVQDYVCAEVQGSKDMTGPDAAKYLTASAGVQGITGNPQQIVTATESYPFIPPSQQLYWLGATLHDPTSRIVKAYQQTGTFLVWQGRLSSAPSAAQIAQHIDITFVKKALSGGCPS
jgi:NitT/TauT family transport system substrate-binding protein/taurine transport system substrate-binding protein